MTEQEEKKPEPLKPEEQCNIDGRQRAHNWSWVWDGKLWSNKVRCTTCGLERVQERKDAR